MAHSKRDIINAERAKLAEGVGADPGIEVGGTTHVGDISEPESRRFIGLLHEAGIDIGSVSESDFVEMPLNPTDEDGNVVIHNAEQVTILGDLQRLKADANAVIEMAKATRAEDESLYRQDVEWDEVTCAHAERWIDDAGILGWRVGIQFADPSARKFLAYIEGKLSVMGWEDTIAEAWGG